MNCSAAVLYFVFELSFIFAEDMLDYSHRDTLICLLLVQFKPKPKLIVFVQLLHSIPAPFGHAVRISWLNSLLTCSYGRHRNFCPVHGDLSAWSSNSAIQSQPSSSVSLWLALSLAQRLSCISILNPQPHLISPIVNYMTPDETL